MPARPFAASVPPPLLRRGLLFGAGLLVLFVAVQLLPGSAPEAAESVATETFRPTPDRGAPSLFSAGNVIALVLLAGGGALALVLRRQSDGPSAGHLRPVGRLQLAPGQQLRLVRCGGEVLLLGVTSGRITLLQRYPADTFEAADALALPEDAPVSPGFADLLRHRLGRPPHA